LPGTTSEINGIADLFGQVFPGGSLTMATDAVPTEDFVYRMAGNNQYVHLATHGFYAPLNWSAGQQSKSELQLKTYIEQYLPSMLSGLALAGANRNAISAGSGEESEIPDDGLLTSLEVAALDLRKVDLAVLSACESTLGQAPIGEGMLGLQRAFQVAGVRSTVTSLWKVDDAATQALMVEFYRNLWERRMSKLEALRQAQLTMLNRYDASSKELKPRGLTLLNPDQNSGTDQRLAPYYWASFVLSGDWR
jgi:CHAT domain-containing protein